MAQNEHLPELDDIDRSVEVLHLEFCIDSVSMINCLDRALKIAGIPEESELDRTE
jgi:hypothetical protein